MVPARRAAALTIAAALAAAGCGGSGDDGGAATTVARPPAAQAPAGARGTLADVPGLYRRLEPSVVAILVRSPRGRAEGTGVAWDEHVIVTNAHVVEGATAATVVLADGSRREAKVRARDVRTDLAVLDLPGASLPPAEFSDHLPAPGSLAVALGNPLGFEGSITAGVISGVDRAIPSGGRTPSLVGLLQTDAAISPGNSGGALVGADGKVMGINVAYIPPEQHAVSIGFAIPSTTVRDVVAQLLETGHAEHAYLGTQLQQITPEIAQQLDVQTGAGTLVAAVVAGGPAAKAGVERGDVLVTLAGHDLRTIEDVQAALREHEPGDEVQATVVRRGHRRTVTITLGDRPPVG